MSTATLTSKGQLTLPQEVRRALGVRSGDRLDFIPDERGGFRMVPLRMDVRSLRGRFANRVTKPATVEQMSDAVEEEATARVSRARSSRLRSGGGTGSSA